MPRSGTGTIHPLFLFYGSNTRLQGAALVAVRHIMSNIFLFGRPQGPHPASGYPPKEWELHIERLIILMSSERLKNEQ